MISGTKKRELEVKFKAALAAVFNKLGTIDSALKPQFEDVLDVTLIDSPDGASLQYDYTTSIVKKAKESVARIAKLLQVDREDCDLLSGRAMEFMGTAPSELFSLYLERKGKTFPLKSDAYDPPGVDHSVPREDEFAVWLQAKNLPELVRGFNEMLDDFQLPAYKITLPPEQQKGGGGRSGG